MTQARKHQIDCSVTPYYHCINRCVRRAYLCGEDELSGRSYSHRKQWVVDQLKTLSDVFAIDICAYAVMSNHYHLVLHIGQAQAEQWSEREVVQRWCSLFKGDALTERWMQGEALGAAARQAVSDTIDKWRHRLMDVSWFMRCLNERIARLANAEDGCKGRFWEGRFKSQALLDEAALLSCMVYVDLNPIRAGIATEAQASDFTSIEQRLHAFAQRGPGRPKKAEQEPTSCPPLMEFERSTDPSSCEGHEREDNADARIPFAFDAYCALLDWTGRAIREDKKGAIPQEVAPLVQSLGLKPAHWVDTVRHFESRFPLMMGRIDRLKQALGRFKGKGVGRWCRGVSVARQCYA